MLTDQQFINFRGRPVRLEIEDLCFDFGASLQMLWFLDCQLGQPTWFEQDYHADRRNSLHRSTRRPHTHFCLPMLCLHLNLLLLPASFDPTGEFLWLNSVEWRPEHFKCSYLVQRTPLAARCLLVRLWICSFSF